MATKMRMTAEEYLALPEEKPYLEYFEGEVAAKPMPNLNHAQIVAELILALGAYRARAGGRMGPEPRIAFASAGLASWLLPDLAFWGSDRAIGDPRRPTPPTLAVEVRSPEQPTADLERKCRFYRENGVDVCWLVDPELRTLVVFEGEQDGERVDELLTSACLPGFELVLSALWRVLD